jgi:hypothetical protein
MTKYIKGKDGKFTGSIGDGKSTVPVSIASPIQAEVAEKNVGDQYLDEQLRASIATHFRYRIYPPIPESMIDPCFDAINNCAQGESDALVKLPNGTLWQGKKSAPSHALVNGHRLENHLETWVTMVYGEDNYDEDYDKENN